MVFEKTSPGSQRKVGSPARWWILLIHTDIDEREDPVELLIHGKGTAAGYLHELVVLSADKGGQGKGHLRERNELGALLTCSPAVRLRPFDVPGQRQALSMRNSV